MESLQLPAEAGARLCGASTSGIDSGTVPLPRRDRGPLLGTGHDAHALRRRPGRGLAESQIQPSPRSEGVDAEHLLLDDCWDERLEDAPGARDAKSDESAYGVGEHGMAGHETRCVVVAPEHPGEAREQLRTARAPGSAAYVVGGDLVDRARDGARWHPTRAPQALSVESRRRITGTAAKRTQGQPDIDGAVEPDITCQRFERCGGHLVSLTDAYDDVGHMVGGVGDATSSGEQRMSRRSILQSAAVGSGRGFTASFGLERGSLDYLLAHIRPLVAREHRNLGNRPRSGVRAAVPIHVGGHQAEYQGLGSS